MPQGEVCLIFIFLLHPLRPHNSSLMMWSIVLHIVLYSITTPFLLQFSGAFVQPPCGCLFPIQLSLALPCNVRGVVGAQPEWNPKPSTTLSSSFFFFFFSLSLFLSPRWAGPQPGRTPMPCSARTWRSLRAHPPRAPPPPSPPSAPPNASPTPGSFSPPGTTHPGEECTL